MPYNRRGSYGRKRSYPRSVVNSIKNVADFVTAGAVSTTTNRDLAVAVNTPLSTSQAQVSQGCIIKAIWIQFSIFASSAIDVGITNFVDCYLFKNVGANLTRPNPASLGTSNEKRFVIRQQKGMIGARTEGTPAFTNGVFGQWIKIPQKYQRMATDDVWQFVTESEGSAHVTCLKTIYKWYR